ncbi:hypothetical protein COF61_25500 [Bacillus toyonensis]|nr:hypothetical protein COF61_25500 [Bacillus toyonensis]
MSPGLSPMYSMRYVLKGIQICKNKKSTSEQCSFLECILHGLPGRFLRKKLASERKRLTITYEKVVIGVTMKVLKTQQNNPFKQYINVFVIS